MSQLVVDHSLDGQTQYPAVVAILAVGSVLSTAAVVARACTRLFLLHTFGMDDAIMVIAQFLTIGTAVAEGLEARWGLGRHVWLFDVANNVPYMKAFYSSIVVYNVAVCLVKISILLQYRRIFAGPIMQRLTLIFLVFISCWAITLAFLLSLSCMPVAKFWDPTIPGMCLDNLTIWYVMAGVNLVTDFSIFSMPLPVIKSLQLPRRQKIMLMGVFGLGFLTCAISIIRIQTLRVAAQTQDPTYDNTPAAYWSFLELIIGVIAACLPTLRPIFVRMMPKLFGANTSAQFSGTGPSGRRNTYGARSHGYVMHGNKSNGGAGSANWSRSGGGKLSKSALSSPTTLKDSDSAEELYAVANMGKMGQRDGSGRISDAEYGLQDLGRIRDPERAEGYRVEVSTGAPRGSLVAADGRQGAPRPDGRIGSPAVPWGIKATTVITRQVDIDDGARKKFGDSRSDSM